MRTKLQLAALLLLPFCVMAQPASFSEFREYEGLYEYVNKSSLELAVSPRDKSLYAIIDNNKYLLRPLSKDFFVNSTNDTVFFLRNNGGTVSGYRVHGQEFKFLKKGDPEKLVWYARPPKQSGRYTVKQSLRPKLNDGLDVGSPRSAGLDEKALQTMIGKVVDGTYADVHSILLYKDDKLVLEEYFYEYNRNSLHELRSATKSFISALVGIAIDKGMIKSVDEPVVPYFTEFFTIDSTGLKQKITIRHLLTNQAGWDCDISNEASAGNENLMGMSPDWAQFTLNLPMLDTPGTRGRYCSGNAIVLGRIVEKVSGMKLSDFAKEHLFKPLAINASKWNFKPDASSANTFCQLYLRPRDILKFGILYLKQGNWKDKQVIPAAWVDGSFASHSQVNGTDYGYLWWKQWLNDGGTRVDGITAKGNGGQRIYLFPQYNMVAVITGGSFNINSPSDAMLIHHILPAIKSKKD